MVADTHSPVSARPEGRVARHPMSWWREALIMAGFYTAYTMVRNFFSGTSLGDEHPAQAFGNAIKVIRIERALGLFHEETIQDWFLNWRWIIKSFNIFYGSAHFVVTLGIYALLFHFRKDVFHLFRNALAVTTATALVCFSLFPLMPPRLLDSSCNKYNPAKWGGACYETDLFPGMTSKEPDLSPIEFSRFGFVDTMDTVHGLWSFNSEAMQGISNQYAAMPSLHIGWSMWCAIGLWPLVRRNRWRIAVLLHPIVTFVCIVATGNHFWLDAAGGLTVLGFGFLVARLLQRWYDRRWRNRTATVLPAG